MADLRTRDRLIVALDLPTVEGARVLVARIGSAVSFYKIGLELVMAGGLDLARELAGAGKKIFLDMKLLDIENTVERATRNAAAAGATFLTVHAHDAKALRAAVAGRSGTGLRILGVTVLTNLDATGASSQILGRIASLLFTASVTDRDAGAALAQAKTIFEGLQHGRIDRLSRRRDRRGARAHLLRRHHDPPFLKENHDHHAIPAGDRGGRATQVVRRPGRARRPRPQRATGNG